MFFCATSCCRFWNVLSSRKPCDSYPRTDRSRRTLAKNDLPSSGADVWLSPRNGISPYTYILYLYFSGFLTFFDDFWRFLVFIDFLCTIAMFFDVFLADRFHLFDIAIFKFFPIWEMGSIFSFFGLFFYRYFFWIVLIFYKSFYFLALFFIVFYRFFGILFFGRFLSNVASVGRSFFL